MTEQDATILADAFIEKVLLHQGTVLGENSLFGESRATEAAKGLAAFRKTLIEELKKQPQ